MKYVTHLFNHIVSTCTLLTTMSKSRTTRTSRVPALAPLAPVAPSTSVTYGLVYEETIVSNRGAGKYAKWSSKTTFAPRSVWNNVGAANRQAMMDPDSNLRVAMMDPNSNLRVLPVRVPVPTETVAIIYHIYETGDTFGRAEGEWHIDDVCVNEEDGIGRARVIKARLEKEYKERYFDRLSDVYVYVARVRKEAQEEDRLIHIEDI